MRCYLIVGRGILGYMVEFNLYGYGVILLKWFFFVIKIEFYILLRWG